MGSEAAQTGAAATEVVSAVAKGALEARASLDMAAARAAPTALAAKLATAALPAALVALARVAARLAAATAV